MQGAHDFNSGIQVGSVSASSGAYSHYRSDTFTYTGSTSTLKVSTP